ncbi:MAG: hypothetical protein HAW58_03385 [Candidatus Thioglobus sp.]|nr:hypothetical protein [Candidatus Thioglobus sp.]
MGDEVDIYRLQNFKNNAFFKDYSEALKLAKMILKRFAYNLKNTNTKNLTPPFYINMSLLFEQYVYALLLDENEVKYQFKKTDFLVNDMIIDTKYKPQYKDKNEDEDIAQLARYGRNKAIRQEINLDEQIAKCLIIYPNKNGQDLTDNLWNDAAEITQFKEFKKIGIKLPTN